MTNYDNQFYQSSMSNLQGSDGEFIKGDSPQSKIIPKTITENGTYDASADNADGYSKVTVDVAGGGGGETFDVEMTLTEIEAGESPEDPTHIITTSKTLQETLDAIKAGKQIRFSVTINEAEGHIYCYGVYSGEVEGLLGTGILMMVSAQNMLFPVCWLGDANIWATVQNVMIIAGVQA